MKVKREEIGPILIRWLFSFLIFSCAAFAALVPVKHREGVSHGFIVLHSQAGPTLATGDTIQTVEGDRVTSEVILHFKDGSLHDEATVFSQNKEFRLISDHRNDPARRSPSRSTSLSM